MKERVFWLFSKFFAAVMIESLCGADFTPYLALKALLNTLSFKNFKKFKINFFKLKTSLDLFYRVGVGAIENQQLKDYAAQKSNTFINFFKNKIINT